MCVIYVEPPSTSESAIAVKKRHKLMNTLCEKNKTEKELKELCDLLHISYQPPTDSETKFQMQRRHDLLRKECQQKKSDSNYSSNMTDKPSNVASCEHEMLSKTCKQHTHVNANDAVSKTCKQHTHVNANDVVTNGSPCGKDLDIDFTIENNSQKHNAVVSNTGSDVNKNTHSQTPTAAVSNTGTGGKSKENSENHKTISEKGNDANENAQVESKNNENSDADINQHFASQPMNTGSSELHESANHIPIASELSSIHPNENVVEAMKRFEEGELKHSVASCKTCFECRPVFHATKPLRKAGPNESSPVEVKPWKIGNDGRCSRCHTEYLGRKKQLAQKGRVKAARFSGAYTTDDDDLGPVGTIRHNNMHFEEVPPYLKGLTMLEESLIRRITVIMNIHLLRYGMLSSKGHSISLPQRMRIAKELPRLPTEVGIVVIRKTSNTGTMREYTVKREKVENALRGLCFGKTRGWIGTSQWCCK